MTYVDIELSTRVSTPVLVLVAREARVVPQAFTQRLALRAVSAPVLVLSVVVEAH